MINLYRTNGRIEEFPVNPSLQAMQNAVSGMIQMVPLEKESLPDLYLVCDDEGKIKGDAVNFEATKIWIKYYGDTDIIVGNVLIADVEDIQ